MPPLVFVWLADHRILCWLFALHASLHHRNLLSLQKLAAQRTAPDHRPKWDHHELSDRSRYAREYLLQLLHRQHQVMT